jgi:hypothetical protein
MRFTRIYYFLAHLVRSNTWKPQKKSRITRTNMNILTANAWVRCTYYAIENVFYFYSSRTDGGTTLLDVGSSIDMLNYVCCRRPRCHWSPCWHKLACSHDLHSVKHCKDSTSPLACGDGRQVQLHLQHNTIRFRLLD